MSTAVGRVFSSAMIQWNFHDPTLAGDRPGGLSYRYLTKRTALPRSLYSSSSTRFLVSRMPKPPGRRPSSARTSTWRMGESAGLEMAACGRRSEEHTSELQSLRHLVCRL